MAIWHEGEVAVQARAGVREQADDLRGMYRAAVEPGLVGFLSQQQFAALTTVDAQGWTWIAPVVGERGMIEVLDPQVVRLNRALIETALPVEDIRGNANVGMIVMSFARKIRVRINGLAGVEPDGSVVMQVRQVYGNCSQRITRRSVEPVGRRASAVISRELSAAQAEMIASVDTFFIGSVHPASGADASHRGGPAGFVKVEDGRRITFPDYPGNNMFNTLGNVEVNPRVGLLFYDFESGRYVQVTGTASVDYDEARAKEFEGARWMVDLKVEEVREFGS